MKKGHSFFPKNRRGQVWVETVIYTLIALVMIGLVLSFARPKIQELQDKIIIDQSIELMKELDSTILNLGAEGNRRVVELGVKRGELTFDGTANAFVFEMEGQSEYSQPGLPISDGNLIILTEKRGSANFVTITRDYSASYNMQFEGSDTAKVLTKSTVPYKVSISNEGNDDADPTKVKINMELV